MRSSTHARYSQRYPRQGKAAILCEGDIAGYEVDLIEKWSAMKTDRAYIDVWPCGTRKAIFGVSDVLGRCVPIFVIEDRDFRTDELANRQCEENMNDRKKRGVDLRFWRAWRRHEIENYLIEPAVVVPTLAATFGVHESAVSSRLDTIIERSRIDQAAQSALEFYRSQLPETHKHIGGLPRKEARPLWDDNKREIVEPSAEVVESKLGEVLEASSAKSSKYDGTSNAKSALEYFRAQTQKWTSVTRRDSVWLIDWAGKEILERLCRWLAGEFGWPTGDSDSRKAIKWNELVTNRLDAEKDREIAWTLQPLLVKAFLELLDKGGDNELHREWTDIIEHVAVT